VGCPEEVAYAKKFITAIKLRELAGRYDKTAYGRYLQRLADERSTCSMQPPSKLQNRRNMNITA
jgi:hypothetical protein